jgi:hypothetical protein
MPGAKSCALYLYHNGTLPTQLYPLMLDNQQINSLVVNHCHIKLFGG